MKYSNNTQKNKEFTAKLKSATQAYALSISVTWSSYFGEKLFPGNPTGAEQVQKAFDTASLTSWQIAHILYEIGDFAYPLITNEKVEKFETETEFKDEMLETMVEVGKLVEKTTKILNADSNDSLDVYEAKKLSRLTQKLLSKVLTTHLKVEKAKGW